MNGNCADPTCSTIQIIEPNGDLIVDTSGANTDVDEAGSVALSIGQTFVSVGFQTAKLSPDYHFEYLYITAPGVNPGSITIVPTAQTIGGFVAVFAGTPIPGYNYTLYWRVVIRGIPLLPDLDLPENLYLPMPQTNTMSVVFHNLRSGINYGFSELRVENLNDPPGSQAIIRVQVYQKTTSGFLLAVNPTPPSVFYYLAVRTP